MPREIVSVTQGEGVNEIPGLTTAVNLPQAIVPRSERSLTTLAGSRRRPENISLRSLLELVPLHKTSDRSDKRRVSDGYLGQPNTRRTPSPLCGPFDFPLSPYLVRFFFSNVQHLRRHWAVGERGLGVERRKENETASVIMETTRAVWRRPDPTASPVGHVEGARCDGGGSHAPQLPDKNYLMLGRLRATALCPARTPRR
ncbi:hypothetical protein MRX96_035576 [Rhipicephalus microplus]